MSTNATPIKFPVGRLVQGSLYKRSTTNMEGVPLIYKSGKEQGQPRTEFFFRVALPKNGSTDFRQTPWGAQLAAVALAGFPQGQSQLPAFSWKVIDGDSAIPNLKGNKPCDNEGFPGHWVVSFKGSYAPKTASAINGQAAAWLNTPDAIKLGDYVEVAASIEGNATQLKPGLYINYDAVCLRMEGPAIIVSRDVSEMGFGVEAMPANIALQQHVAANAPLPPTVNLTPSAPAAPLPPTGVDPRITDKARAAGAKTLEDALAWPNWNLPLLQAQGYAV